MICTLLCRDKGLLNDVNLGWVYCLLKNDKYREVCSARALNGNEELIPCH